VPSRSGAYAIHLYGPWGSGKTTLLNLLKRHLEQEDTEDRPEAQNGTSQGQGKEERKKNWQVVEYNAWRNQHIQPPWWSLMEQVFTTTRKSLSPWNRFREYWWRFNTGRLPYIAALIVLAWVLALIVFPLLRHQASGQGTLAYLAASSDNISKIIALVATIWGGIFAINRSLLLGAAQAAKRYSDLTHDPTSMIKRRFTELIHRTPKRVAVFIDDLDRCQSQFVVNLLEGIQTLFRDAPVVFVVSADRQWLNGCYEDVYEKLKPRVHEPGKPLGALFLEKAFRFATPMPGIPDELKKAFWEYLLDLKPSDWKSQIGIARETARSRLREAGSEEDVRRLVREHAEQPYPDQRAFREEAVVRLAAPEVIERMEHALHPYHVLLEPNPRAMKLLVNAYSANLALSMLSEVEIDRHQMALWTILGSRWPQLAEHLLKNPDLLDKLKNSDASNIPEAIKGLFESPVVDQVRQIVYGGEIGPELSVETIRHCKRICL
jgi:DNA polymerase III delta prime subunit